MAKLKVKNNSAQKPLEQLIEWNPKWETGIRLIDEQHKSFLKILAKLEKVSNPKNKQIDPEKIKEILQETTVYTLVHFITEEEVLKIYEYPDFEEHKKIHDDFRLKLAKLKNETDFTNTKQVIHLSEFLRAWLVGHIQKIDKKFSKHLRSQGLR